VSWQEKTGQWASRAVLRVFASESATLILAGMMELKQFRTFLGPVATQFRPDQLAQLRKEMCEMAKLLLDVHLERHAKKTGHQRTVDPDSFVDK